MNVESGVGAAEPTSPLALVVEDFGRSHPGLNPDLLIEPTRIALSRYHRSPASFRLSSPRGEMEVSVHFGLPDPRSVNTVERERCVEEGAIVVGAMLLARSVAMRITRVVSRRGRADYFLESPAESGFWLLEVSGTDQGDVHARARVKMQQLRSTPYRSTAGFHGSYVAVTRFAPDACCLIEHWSHEVGD